MDRFPLDSPFEYRTLVEKAAYIKRNSLIALGLSILGFLICGFLGIFSFIVAGSVIETIDYYDICKDRRPLAMAAKVISVMEVVLWTGVLIVRFLVIPRLLPHAR
jgi:hypothetical protein